MRHKEFTNTWLWESMEQIRFWIGNQEGHPDFVLLGMLTKQNENGDYTITVLYKD